MSCPSTIQPGPDTHRFLLLWLTGKALNGEQFCHDDEVKAKGLWWVHHFICEKYPKKILKLQRKTKGGKLFDTLERFCFIVLQEVLLPFFRVHIKCIYGKISEVSYCLRI
jgi:hypothetical protein